MHQHSVVQNCWKTVSESLSLDILKICLNTILCYQLWVNLLYQGDWTR